MRPARIGGDAGVADPDIDVVEVGQRGVDHGADAVLGAEVARDRLCADALGRFAELFVEAVADHDPRAEAAEPLRDRGTDAAGGAGHDDALT